MSERGDSCFPSIASLAGDTSTSESTVSTALKTLIDAKWLARKSGGGRGRSTRYTALVPETTREPGSLEEETTREPGSLGRETTREPGTTTTKEVNQRLKTPERAIARRAPNPIWDVLVEIYGEPLARGKAGRGRIVADLRERLVADGFREAEPAVAEIRRRYAALESEWGSRATARSLVEHWRAAGAMAADPKTRGLTPEEIARRAVELREGE